MAAAACGTSSCRSSKAATIVFLVLVFVAAVGGSSKTAGAAWVVPFHARRQSSWALPRGQQRHHARRGAAALSASLLLSDPALLEHAASLLATQAAHAAQHDPTGHATLLFLAADNPLTDALPDASELLKQLPKLDDFADSIPKIELPQQLPSQLQDALKAAPGALDSLKEFAQGLKDGASSLADGAGKVSLPSLPKVDLGEAPLSKELKAKVAELQGSVGDAVGSKLSELGGAVSEQVGKALAPYQPLIDQTTAQFGERFSVVKQLADEVSKEVSKETQQLEPALGALKSVKARQIFNVENAVALPFWLTLILAPNNGLVKGLMSSSLPIIVAALAYIWAAYLALQDPVALSGFSGSIDLGTLTKGFSSETAVACAWAHFIAQDLFVGRWIYLDGMRNGVWTAHSLALAFFFGPTGILSHLLTRGVVRIFRWDVEDIMTAGTRDVAPSAAEGVSKMMLKDAEKQAKSQLRAADKEADKLLAKAKGEARRLVQEARAEAESALSQEKELKRRAEKEAQQILEKARKEADRILASAKAADSQAGPVAETP